MKYLLVLLLLSSSAIAEEQSIIAHEVYSARKNDISSRFWISNPYPGTSIVVLFDRLSHCRWFRDNSQQAQQWIPLKSQWADGGSQDCSNNDEQLDNGVK